MLRICALSDLHGNLPEIPDCDLVLIAGDICADDYAEKQVKWLDTKFRSWLEKIKSPVVGIAGNHDWAFQETPELVPNLPWIYLQDSSALVKGYKVFGTPWSSIYGTYPFMLSERQLMEKWSYIPSDTDILVCHGPPMYYGDRNYQGLRVGSPTLHERILIIKPKLVVFGHVHEDHGYWERDGIKLANVSVVEKGLKMVYKPTMINLD